jgi:hypothetical protein
MQLASRVKSKQAGQSIHLNEDKTETHEGLRNQCHSHEPTTATGIDIFKNLITIIACDCTYSIRWHHLMAITQTTCGARKATNSKTDFVFNLGRLS